MAKNLIWLCQLLDIMVSYHHVISYRRTDESDFIGCSPTNVKRPMKKRQEETKEDKRLKNIPIKIFEKQNCKTKSKTVKN